jgi:methyltransferase-like protein
VFNTPCYFRDFVQRARAHGLEYLAEARPENMFVRNYGPVAVHHLLADHGDDHVLVEQHLDFAVNRSYRQTLLVHSERAPQISRTLDRSRNRRLHVAAWLPPVAGQARLDHSKQPYGADGAAKILVSDPSVKAALEALNSRWPWTLSWPELRAAARSRLVRSETNQLGDVEAAIDGLIEVLVMRGLARYRLDPVSPQPECTPVRVNEAARRMAELTRDDAEAFIFNHWHESLPLSPLDSHLLPLLDGSHDRDALVEVAVNLFRQNVIRIDCDDIRLVDEAAAREVLTEEIDTMPLRLVELKLLGIGDGAVDCHRPQRHIEAC